MKPVMYLDIDGVLWDVDLQKVPGRIAMDDAYKGANGVAGFMEWVLARFEVRWLTAWAMKGHLDAEDLELLARYTAVPVDVWAQVKPNLGWRQDKCQGISWGEHLQEGRPFVWIEDGLTPSETQTLQANGLLHRYYHTDVFADPNALIKTQALIASLMDRGGLAVTP